jgi:uncharacterized membrane protein
MHFLLQILEKFRNILISGLLTLLPLTVTVAFFGFVFRFIRSWVSPLRAYVPLFLQKLPFAEYLVILCVIIIVGLITHSFLIKGLWHLFESFLEGIPFLRPVYFGVKQLVMAFTKDEQESFQKIALIEFPRKGVYSIGFITGVVPPKIISSDVKYYSAYIPTTPNPATGHCIMVPQEECIIIDISKQEAMSLIMSGGIVQPKHF